MRVLFVCDGNICRSPMARAYLDRMVEGRGLEHVAVDSAGLLGIEDAPAAAEAVRLLAELDIDLTRHRSKGLSGTLLETCDLVIGMTLDQLQEIEQRWPRQDSRMLLLRAFEAGPEPRAGAPDLADPIGQPEEVFAGCFATIRSCVDNLALHLRYP